MEETDCMVCFSPYNDEQRPRSLQCGHTLCTKCLERAIREESKMCPKCRTHYSANDVTDIPVNFSLEGVVKLLNIYRYAKTDIVTECAKLQCAVHHRPVRLRCSAHKAWICQRCLNEDHSSESCEIISINEELSNQKSRKLGVFEPFLKRIEETFQKGEDCKTQFKTLIKDYEDDVIRCETMITRLQEEIQRKKKTKIEMEERNLCFDKKMVNMKNRKIVYDQAVTSLVSSNSIQEVSQCSIEVMNEAEQLQSVSCGIEKEMDLILQSFKIEADKLLGIDKLSEADKFLGFHKLTVRNGQVHLHLNQDINNYKSSPDKLQYIDENDPPQTDGILTFLDIAWPGQEPQRIYMEMLGNTTRARQHLLLVTGQCGYSYKDLTFQLFDDDFLEIFPYDGNKAAPLLEDVTVNDNQFREKKAGLVTCAVFDEDNCNSNNALFGVHLENGSYELKDYFAKVTSGLNILKDIAKSNEINEIKIVDCGVVLSW